MDASGEEKPKPKGLPNTKVILTFVACGLITFLVVAGTFAKDINYTAIALGLVSLLGLMWGDPLNRRNGSDDK
jgi:hypothetical protein